MPNMMNAPQGGMIGQAVQADQQGVAMNEGAGGDEVVEQETGELTITADLVKKHIFEQIEDPNDKKTIDRIVYAGMKVMFSKETHQLMLDEIARKDVPIEDRLGMGIASLMFILFDQSKNTMPKGAIIPAGSILLAEALDFVDKSGIEQVNDDVYADAVQTMTTTIMGKFDPKYAEKVGKAKAGLPLENTAAQQQQRPAGLIEQAQAGPRKK